MPRFFSKVVTTPNILTEVSNLSNSLPERVKFNYFSEFARKVTILEEVYLESRQVCGILDFNKFGLTDSGIAYMLPQQYLVLTVYFPLAGYLQKIGVAVVNFNHIRTLNWSNW